MSTNSSDVSPSNTSKNSSPRSGFSIADIVGPRIRLNGKSTKDYHESLVQLFGVMARDVPGFQFKNLKCIHVDFEIAFSNAFREILGDEKADAVLQGCEVHFLRSATRIAKRVAIDDHDERMFVSIARKILEASTTDEVLTGFNILTAELLAPNPIRNDDRHPAAHSEQCDGSVDYLLDSVSDEHAVKELERIQRIDLKEFWMAINIDCPPS